jgi:hypothetical protein
MKSLRLEGIGSTLLRCFWALILFFVFGFESDAQCPVNVGNDVTICAGQSVTLGGNPVMSNPPNNATYNWSANTGPNPNDEENPTVSPTVNTVYTLNVNGSGGGVNCDAASGPNSGIAQICNRSSFKLCYYREC